MQGNQFNLDEFTGWEEIGRGQNSTVFRVTHRTTHRVYASKRIYSRGTSSEAFDKEIDILKRIGHPSIVKLHSFIKNDDFFYLILDYVEGKTLEELLFRKKTVSNYDKDKIIRELLSLLSFLQKERISHNDLKPTNIIVKHDSSIVLIDFGIGSILSEDGTTTSTVKGTPNYIAPERVLQPEKISFESDIYSAGVIIYEVITEKKLFSFTSMHEAVLYYSRNNSVQLSETELDTNHELIRKMLAFLPEERGSNRINEPVQNSNITYIFSGISVAAFGVFILFMLLPPIDRSFGDLKPITKLKLSNIPILDMVEFYEILLCSDMNGTLYRVDNNLRDLRRTSVDTTDPIVRMLIHEQAVYGITKFGTIYLIQENDEVLLHKENGRSIFEEALIADNQVCIFFADGVVHLFSIDQYEISFVEKRELHISIESVLYVNQRQEYLVGDQFGNLFVLDFNLNNVAVFAEIGDGRPIFGVNSIKNYKIIQTDEAIYHGNDFNTVEVVFKSNYRIRDYAIQEGDRILISTNTPAVIEYDLATQTEIQRFPVDTPIRRIVDLGDLVYGLSDKGEIVLILG